MERVVQTIAILAVCLAMIGLGANASDLIISEIAWAGTAASSNDEWIELKNTGDVSIDLLGWELAFDDVIIPLGEVRDDTLEVRTTMMAPGAFFILERTNDDSISDIAADLIYKGSLSNSGVLIELRNPQGMTVDSTVMTESGWPAGSAGADDFAYATMERSLDGEWTSNNGSICNGLDANGNPLVGTPGQDNCSEVMAQWTPTVDITFPAEAGIILSDDEWITWTSTDPDGEASALAMTLYIQPSPEDDWVLLVEGLANTGTFWWDMSEYDHGSGDAFRLMIRAEDADGYTGEDVSELFKVEKTANE